VLLALSERFGVPSDDGVRIDLKLTNDDLAAIAGVSRQFANATLQDLRKRGVIAAHGQGLVLTQPGALEKLAHQP
jgi:CRP/FNR family cyclic AMP-dependent transcriptional regulator